MTTTYLYNRISKFKNSSQPQQCLTRPPSFNPTRNSHPPLSRALYIART